MDSKNGITLTSLAITVTILIILAGVGIGTLGPNGLIAKAEEAKEQAQIDEEREIVGTSVVESVGENRYGNIEKAELEVYLERNAKNREIEVIDDEDILIVEFKDSNRYYEIDVEGNVKKIDIVKDENSGNITVGISGEKLEGTAEKPYEIWCIEDLIEWSQNYTSYSTASIKLCRTLNFTSKLSYSDSSTTNYGDINTDGETEALIEEMQKGIGFDPINTFKGVFNGQGFEIKNIYMKDTKNLSLFTYLSGATIENLGITGNIISGYHAAGIAYWVDKNDEASRISNCYSEVNIVAQDSSSASNGTGGICGSTGNKTIIQNCYNAGDIIGNACVGGIVGNGAGRIEYCYNLGEIVSKATMTYNAAGGIIGAVIDKSIVVSNCYNAEKIDGINTSSGGIIGNIRSAGSGIADVKIFNCYNLGQVSGTDLLGGIVGNCNSNSTNSITNVKIKNCYNYGGVGQGGYIGGIVGQIWKINGTLSIYMDNIVNLGEVSQSATQKGEIIGRKVSATVAEVNNAFYNSANANKGIGSGTVTGTIEAGDIDSNLVTTLNEYVTTYNTENASNTDFDELKIWQINSNTGKLELK